MSIGEGRGQMGTFNYDHINIRGGGGNSPATMYVVAFYRTLEALKTPEAFE